MRLLNLPSRTRTGKGAAIWLFCAMALGSALAPQARANFLGSYDFSDFTLSTTSDGFAYTPDSGLTAVIVGGNDGSGVPGTTDLVTNAAAAGIVQFNYLYNSLDDPTFDAAGYLLNGVYSQFADTNGESGTISFAVNSGDSFGFQVWTADNLGEPGILTVSNFSAPDGAASSGVPEPRTLPMVLLAAAFVAAYRWTKRRNEGNKGNA